MIDLETKIKMIPFDKFYLEATFQFMLMMELTSLFCKKQIMPEFNIEHYGLKVSDFVKKEIDIVIEQENNDNIAIELKMPMNGQVPEQMFSFIKDICFLEQLKKSGEFPNCFFIAVTNDKKFWEGREQNGIYQYFRDGKELTGNFEKPTGENKYPLTLKGKYKVEWKILNDDFKYFIIEV
ncbi:MAG: hypothetical protein LBN27_13310 [Prevotellaceae bacterium]|jgi:hypothetical protein|nr:hypothetical protein [Prevotellaceae bacterium]